MTKTDFDPHIAGPRVSADQLVMAALFCMMLPMVRLGLGAAGIADFESGDLSASLPVVALTEVAFIVLTAYLLTVATGAFEVLVRAGRFFVRDFTSLLTFLLGILAIRYSETTSIVSAFPPEITHGAADAPLSGSRFLQAPRILTHRWLSGTSPHLIFQ
ncbi:MAG: hypothetical protein OXI16_02305 [Chloroflexota bacterium]|nr:hypothetical protein [Chloroflexota bacterium]